MNEKPVPSQQIPLALPVHSAQAREDLIVSEANRVAVELLDAWPDWPGSVAIIVGPPGSGKSHMARIWAQAAHAPVTMMRELDVSSQPATGNHVLEDAGSDAYGDSDAGSQEIDEEALFHLLNFVRSQRGHCLITSRTPPSDWNLALADLRSRLNAAQYVELGEPDDELLRQVVVKLLADRQLSLEPGVVSYLLTRMERSLAAANAVVSEIDRESLVRRSRITRAIAAAALKRLGMN